MIRSTPVLCSSCSLFDECEFLYVKFSTRLCNDALDCCLSARGKNRNIRYNTHHVFEVVLPIGSIHGKKFLSQHSIMDLINGRSVFSNRGDIDGSLGPFT
mmetsp:Transcript_3218/g.7156  ORF Transcript_3218/g.7156 Transcript_3218/m.7156 type:complete len:100 (-) Transcript_3218:371-670(-)